MIRTLSAIAFLVLAASLAAAQDHRGWPRAELTSKAAELLGEDSLAIESVEELPRNLFLLDPTEEASCFLRPGETAEAFRAGDFSVGLLIGNQERVHTLWFYFPIVNVRDGDKAFAFYRDMFGYLFPDWRQAGSWAEDSLGISWNASAKGYQDPMISYEETVVRQSIDGAALATTGVPPDIVVYRVAARPQCERISDYLLAKPRRAQRDPAKRDPNQRSAGLQLYYTHPMPTDVSSTPVFLGEVHGFRPSRSPEKDIRLSSPGPSAGVAVDLNDWLDAQVTPPIADGTWSAIEDGWGYERNFLFQITRPAVLVTGVEDETVLLVTKATGGVRRAVDGEHEVLWTDFSGLLFGTKMHPQPDDRSKEPPYSIVKPEKEIVFMNDGSPAPVDVSATPMHLGQIRQYVGAVTVEMPDPYRASIDGMTLTIEDGKGGAASLDLAAWFRAQKGEPFAPDRTRPISRPSIPFALNGRPHQLVISTLYYTAADSVPNGVSAIFGQVFSAP